MANRSTVILILGLVFVSLAVIAFVSAISLFIVGSGDTVGRGNVALIPVKGIILADKTSGFLGSSTASSTEIVEWIRDADSNPSVKAIILEINSPGGSPVASDEIARAVKAANKPVVAWIRESGTSGAYWIASSCEVIVANRMSITGSIGVISSYLEFYGLMDDYNVTYRRLVSGNYKDIGTPYREMTHEEEVLWQERIDALHQYFIDEVAANRGLGQRETRELANGIFYLGSEAKDLGLVDILGGKEEAIKHLEDTLGIKVRLMKYRARVSFMDVFAGAIKESAFYVGSGLGQELKPKPQTLWT